MQNYPLSWPVGYKRTEPNDRKYWPKCGSMYTVSQNLKIQLEITGARNIIISTNIPAKIDGTPYARYRVPEDPGAAVYFTLDGQESVLCCDQYQKVEMNLRAIALSVEQLRQISKRGVSDFLRRAFTGFKALPEIGTQTTTVNRPWWEVLEVSPQATPEVITAAFRAKLKRAHPDHGGSSQEVIILTDAKRQGLLANG